ncbi:MAG: hypothetical protein ACR2P8_00975 [Myxococcota bacterium]
MRFACCLLASLALVALACDEAPRHESFSVGMTRASVLEQHGEPQRKARLTKRDDRIWGPIEEFWSEVPLGSGVEVWSYRTTNEWGGEPVAGATVLYFVDRSEAVSGLGFAPDGVVYEGGQGGS